MCVSSHLDELILQLLDPVPLRGGFTGLAGQLEFQRGLKKKTNESQEHKSGKLFVQTSIGIRIYSSLSTLIC